MPSELTVLEIIRRVAEAGRSIKSFELNRVRVTNKLGERSEKHSRAIRVRADVYEWSDEDENHFGHPEQLNYRGREYFRDGPDSPWRSKEEEWQLVAENRLTVEHSVPVEIKPGVTWDDTLLSETSGVDFNDFMEATRLEDEFIGGGGKLRLTVTHIVPIGFQDIDAVERTMLPEWANVPPQVREEIREKLLEQPDSLTLKEDIWIEPDTWLLVKMEVEGTARRRGEVTESFVEARSFSKFDEANLPGPLPE